MSFCHQPISVVRRVWCVVRRMSERRQQFALNDIFSETTMPIFDMKHCLVDLYQVCSNGGPKCTSNGGSLVRK